MSDVCVYHTSVVQLVRANPCLCSSFFWFPFSQHRTGYSRQVSDGDVETQGDSRQPDWLSHIAVVGVHGAKSLRDSQGLLPTRSGAGSAIVGLISLRTPENAWAQRSRHMPVPFAASPRPASYFSSAPLLRLLLLSAIYSKS